MGNLLKKIRSSYSKPDFIQGILKRHLEDITQAIEEGYSKKTIFNVLKENEPISCSYEHFVRVLNKLLKRAAPIKGSKKESDSKSPKSKLAYPKKNQFTHDELTPEELKDIHS